MADTDFRAGDALREEEARYQDTWVKEVPDEVVLEKQWLTVKGDLIT